MTRYKKYLDMILENDVKKIILYHGSYLPIKKFDKNFSGQGVFWFSENKDKILSGESGAVSNKYLITIEAQIKKIAGWKEYDKYFLDELRRMGYDSIKLDDDWVIFDSENIKILNVEKTK